MQDFEKTGRFFLGRPLDPDTFAPKDEPLLYDAKDLTTHAVIVGMTGSGKTGLGIGLLEEAAIDGIPSIVIDPKGDLGNLLLAFPDLAAKDFAPWIDPTDAAQKGQAIDAAAEAAAEAWKKGLASWGEDGARIARFRDAAEAVIYTPGSTAGLSMSVLKSFSAPPQAVMNDAEALRDRVSATASGVLALLQINADPMRSREHMLIANILDKSWRDGKSLDLAGLVKAVQRPPLERIGVLDLESAFPEKDRFALAMGLNGILAAPGFAAWTEGEPLDVQRLLWTENNKPRIAVISIAHLSDAERMFFVTTLLNEVISWMRAQPGSPSLRAILYMDEVFGFFPPTANPPSKTPMLTLLKQARAYGLGVVLATQNPVDLDYKGLSNAGTWFLGRLQTERDKMRVLDGLEGAATSAQAFDRARMDKLLSASRKRTFLMSSAHSAVPVLFETRWALSYLCGPLTRAQIQRLMAPRKKAAAPAKAAASAEHAAPVTASGSGERPALPAGIAESFLSARAPAEGERILYKPSILGSARIHYVDKKAGIDLTDTVSFLAPVPEELTLEPWKDATVMRGRVPETSREPAAGATYATLAAAASRPKAFGKWAKALEDHISREVALSVWSCSDLDVTSRPGESRADFSARVADAARKRADEVIEQVRRKHAAALNTLDDRIRTAEGRVGREKGQVRDSRTRWWASFVQFLLRALLGRKTMGGRTSGAAALTRDMGRTSREKEDVERAGDQLQALVQRRDELRAQVEADIAKANAAADAATRAVQEAKVAPRKSDLAVSEVVLAWTPYLVRADGREEAAYSGGS